MTKQQLVEAVSTTTDRGKADVESVVDTALRTIVEALRKNERVDLRGLGSFVVKNRKARQGRNPRTGEALTIAAKRYAGFRPSKELKETLAESQADATTS